MFRKYLFIYKNVFDRSLPFSFLFAILEPNCRARFGRLTTLVSPRCSDTSLNINLSPNPHSSSSLGKHLKRNLKMLQSTLLLNLSLPLNIRT